MVRGGTATDLDELLVFLCVFWIGKALLGGEVAIVCNLLACLWLSYEYENNAIHVTMGK